MSPERQRKGWMLIRFCCSFFLLFIFNSCSDQHSDEGYSSEITKVRAKGEGNIPESKNELILIAMAGKDKARVGSEFWIDFVLVNPTQKEITGLSVPSGSFVTVIVTDEHGVLYTNAIAGSGGLFLIPPKSFDIRSLMLVGSCEDSSGNVAFEKPGRYQIKGLFSAGEGEEDAKGDIHIPSVYSNVVTVEIVP